MKPLKYIITFLISVLIVGNAWARDLDDPGILVGYWRLNSNATDYSGNGNDGTWTGDEAYSTTLWGHSCGEFAGTADYIDINATVVPNGNFSIAAWVNSDISGGIQDIVAQWASGTSDRFTFLKSSSNNYKVYVGVEKVASNTLALPDVWYHVVCIYDQTNISLYVNGIFDHSGAYSSTIEQDADTLIGSYSAGEYFNGQVGEVRIYNVALTADEIKTLYLKNYPRYNPTAQPIDCIPDVSDSTLAGAWLNKSVIMSADLSSNNNDGTVDYLTDPIWLTPGGEFGTSSNIDLGSGSSLDMGSGSFTVSMWLNPASLGAGTHAILQYDDDTYADGWLINGDGSGFSVYMDNPTGSMLISNFFSVGEWVYVVLVADSSADTLQAYKNGETSGSLVTGKTWTFSVGEKLGLGNIQFTGFDGKIKDVRIYSEAKTADWIATEYAKGVPDDSLIVKTGDLGKDISRYRRTATITSSPKLGQGLDFDGTDDKIDYGDTGNIRTVVMWVEPNTTTQEFLLIDTGKDIMVNSGTVTYATVTATATYVNGAASTTMVADVKQHLVCVLSADVDANNLELANDGTNYGDITVHDFRVYNEAKSADWVAMDYEKTRGFY